MITILKNLLPKNAFARGVSILVGGTAGAQLIMVLAAPLLTRLYTPEDFGLLAVYTGLLALFSVVASLRYELAIPLPENDSEAANVVKLSLLLVLLTSLSSWLIVVFVGDQIATALGVPKLSSYFWLLPLGVILSGNYKVLSHWAVRKKHFGDIAQTRITQAIATLAIQLTGYKLGGVALICGQAAGQGVGVVRLSRLALTNRKFRYWDWKGIYKVSMRYKDFPVFSVWSALFYTAGRHIPSVMFAALFGVAAAGWYALAHRVVAMPMSVIGNSVGKVFFSSAAEASRNAELGRLFVAVHKILSEIAMPITILLLLLGPDLFATLFGNNWKEAGDLAKYLAPWLYMVFVASPLSPIFSVLERERTALIFQSGLFLGRVLAIYLGYLVFEDFYLTVIAYSSISAIFWMFFILWACRATESKLSSILYSNFVAFGLASIALSPFLSFYYFLQKPLPLIFGGLLSLILMFGYCLKVYKSFLLVSK